MVAGEMGAQGSPATGKRQTRHSWLGSFEDLDPRSSQLTHELQSSRAVTDPATPNHTAACATWGGTDPMPNRL